MKLFRKRKSIDEIVGKAIEIEKRWQDMDRQNAHELRYEQQVRLIQAAERAEDHRKKTWGRRVRF
jgi:hypothetical protein